MRIAIFKNRSKLNIVQNDEIISTTDVKQSYKPIVDHTWYYLFLFVYIISLLLKILVWVTYLDLFGFNHSYEGKVSWTTFFYRKITNLLYVYKVLDIGCILIWLFHYISTTKILKFVNKYPGIIFLFSFVFASSVYVIAQETNICFILDPDMLADCLVIFQKFPPGTADVMGRLVQDKFTAMDMLKASSNYLRYPNVTNGLVPYDPHFMKIDYVINTTAYIDVTITLFLTLIAIMEYVNIENFKNELDMDSWIKNFFQQVCMQIRIDILATIVSIISIICSFYVFTNIGLPSIPIMEYIMLSVMITRLFHLIRILFVLKENKPWLLFGFSSLQLLIIMPATDLHVGLTFTWPVLLYMLILHATVSIILHISIESKKQVQLFIIAAMVVLAFMMYRPLINAFTSGLIISTNGESIVNPISLTGTCMAMYILYLYLKFLLFLSRSVMTSNNYAKMLERKKINVIQNIYKTCIEKDYFDVNNFDIDKKQKFILVKKYKKNMGLVANERTSFDQCLLGCTNNKVVIAASQLMSCLMPRRLIKHYHACTHTLITALKRQASDSLAPDPYLISLLAHHFKAKYIPRWEEILYAEGLTYHWKKWYNHLSHKQRQEIDVFVTQYPDWQTNSFHWVEWIRTYKINCKGETQLDGPSSKTRAISMPHVFRKMITGPIIYELQCLSRKYFPEYAAGMSYTQRSIDRSNIANKFIEVVNLNSDTMFFDTHQHLINKNAVDDVLYSTAIKHCKGIPEWMFKQKGYGKQSVLEKCLLDHIAIIRAYDPMSQMKQLAVLEQEGKCHSGDMETELANTWRQIAYMDFTMSTVGYTLEKGEYIPKYYTGLLSGHYKLRIAGDDTDNNIDANKFFKHKDVIIRHFRKLFAFKGEDVKMKGLGQRLKFLTYGDIQQSDFCSSHNFKTERNGQDYYRFIRVPKKVIATFGLMDSGRLKPEEWIYATSEAALYWAKYIPIFHVLYERVIDQFGINKPSNKLQSMNDKYPDKVPITNIVEDYDRPWLKNNSYGVNENVIDESMLEHIDRKYKYTYLQKSSSGQPHDYLYAVEWMEKYYGITLTEIHDCEEMIKQHDFTTEKFTHTALEKLYAGMKLTSLM